MNTRYEDAKALLRSVPARNKLVYYNTYKKTRTLKVLFFGWSKPEGVMLDRTDKALAKLAESSSDTGSGIIYRFKKAGA